MLPMLAILLLSSLTVEGTFDVCDTDNIRWPTRREDEGQKKDPMINVDVSRIHCTNNSQFIEYDGQQFESLMCDENKGWMHNTTHLLHPTVRADELLHVTCVPKACHSSLIQGGLSVNDVQKREFDGQKLQCKNSNESLRYTDAGKERMNGVLYCNVNGFWTTYQNGAHVNTSIKSIDVLTVTCAPNACNELLISLGNGVKRENNNLICINPDEGLVIGKDVRRYTDLVCATGVGWTTSRDQARIKHDFDEFSVKCMQMQVFTDCHETLVLLDDGVIRSKENALSCVDQTKRLQLDNDKVFYYSLKCTVNDGWSGTAHTVMHEQQIRASNASFSVECVKQRCKQSFFKGYDAAKMSTSMNKSVVMLQCRDSAEAIKYTESGKDKQGGELFCEMDGFWRTSRRTTTIKDTDTIAVSCVPSACNELWVSLNHGVTRNHDKLACVDHDLQIDDDPARYSDLTCSNEHGWTTGRSLTQIRKSNDEFRVRCVNKPATTTTTDMPSTESVRSAAYKGEAIQVSAMLSICYILLNLF